MRKLIAVTLLLLMIVASVFGEGGDISNASTSFDFTAYKNPELPELRYTILVTNAYTNAANPITGTTNEYDIGDYHNAFNNALKITIQTNLRNEIAVELWFYPFVNEYDPYDFFPCTYAKTGNSSTTVQCEYNSVTYKYTASWSMSGFSNNSIKAQTGSGAHGTITSKISCQKKTNSNSWSSVNYNNIPNEDGVILGFRNNQYIENTMTFKVTANIDDSVRMPEPNMRYVAKVRLVISTV